MHPAALAHILNLTLAQVADLHWLVALGALHAPFWFVHAKTKGALMARSRTAPLLPTRAIAGCSSSAPASWSATLRKQRLKRFDG